MAMHRRAQSFAAGRAFTAEKSSPAPHRRARSEIHLTSAVAAAAAGLVPAIPVEPLEPLKTAGTHSRESSQHSQGSRASSQSSGSTSSSLASAESGKGCENSGSGVSGDPGAQQPEFRSRSCEIPVKLHVRNLSVEALVCRWIDYAGADRATLEVALPPGHCGILNTYATHAWRFVAERTGRSYDVYVCSELPEQVLTIKSRPLPAKKPQENSVPAKPVQAEKGRCFLCEKRVPLALQAAPCRCGYTYCRKHRQAEEHNCSFDFQTAQKAELRKTNLQVVADKLPVRI